MIRSNNRQLAKNKIKHQRLRSPLDSGTLLLTFRNRVKQLVKKIREIKGNRRECNQTWPFQIKQTRAKMKDQPKDLKVNLQSTKKIKPAIRKLNPIRNQGGDLARSGLFF